MTASEPSSSALIVTESLTKLYTLGGIELRALDQVSLRVERGDFVAIMGASGSGKSTLLNVLGCLDSPTSGRYTLNGLEVSSLSRAELGGVRNRTIGFVFQNFNLLARSSARENVELPLLYAGVSRKQRNARALEALSRVGLEQWALHRPSQLSGGQQQRVAIARAIVNRPELMLADEPTGNLDSRTTHEIMALFHRLWKAGLSIVLVTHEPDVAAYASRVVTMQDGRIISDLGQLPRAPAEPAAAERAA